MIRFAAGYRSHIGRASATWEGDGLGIPSATRVIPAVGSKEIAQSQSEAAYLRIRERIVSLEMMLGGEQQAVAPDGSTAVRDAIERHQPLISLHGHIHESKGAVKISKTLSINPDSSYEEGVLIGAIVQLDAKKGIKSYQLISG